MFVYLDSIVELQAQVFKTIESSKQSSMTNSGQCRLKPSIPCIQDSSLLYDNVTKIIFRLHAKLSPDLLSSHRDRFLKISKYPPNFLVQSELQNYHPDRITVPTDNESTYQPHQAGTIPERLVLLDGTTSADESNSPVGDPGVMAIILEEDRQANELEYQVVGLKLEFVRLKMQAKSKFQQLQSEIAELKLEFVLKRQELKDKEDCIRKLETRRVTGWIVS